MLRKGYLGLLGNTHIMVYYTLVLYQRMKVYMVETMDMVNITLTWNMKLQSQ